MLEYKFHQSHGIVKPAALPPPTELINQLPVGVYQFIVVETMQGLDTYFKPIPKFNIPAKLYGDITNRTDRVISAYINTKDKNLGVLLNGLGGTGKSLLAKNICINAMNKLNLPVVVVSMDSVKYIQMLFDILNDRGQNVVIFLDEYDKLFVSDKNNGGDERVKDNQNVLLSLIDGVYSANHLFLLTSNNKGRINDHLLNRPSRIRYYWEYTGLTKELMEEVITDIVNNEEKSKAILDELRFCFDLTYDNLIEFVNECLTYPDVSPSELIDGFNLDSMNGYLITRFKIDLYYDDKSIGDILKDIFGGLKIDMTSRVDNDTEMSDIRRNIARGNRWYYGCLDLKCKDYSKTIELSLERTFGYDVKNDNLYLNGTFKDEIKQIFKWLKDVIVKNDIVIDNYDELINPYLDESKYKIVFKLIK